MKFGLEEKGIHIDFVMHQIAGQRAGTIDFLVGNLPENSVRRPSLVLLLIENAKSTLTWRHVKECRRRFEIAGLLSKEE